MNTNVDQLAPADQRHEQLQPTPGGVSLVATAPALLTYVIGLATRRRLELDRTLCPRPDGGGHLAHGLQELVAASTTETIGVILGSLDELSEVGRAVEMAAAAGKPVVVLDASSAQGTGAEADDPLPARLVHSYLSACGAHYVEGFRGFIDALYTLHHARRYPTGTRVCVLTGSGGVGVLMADQAELVGIDLAEVPPEAQAQLHELWPLASVRNPVDTTAQVINNPALLAEFLRTVLAAGEYDATISFMTHIGLNKEVTDRRRIPLADAAAEHPQVISMVTLLTTPEVQRDFEQDGFLVYEEPFDALAAVATLSAEGRRRQALADRVAATGQGAPFGSVAPDPRGEGGVAESLRAAGERGGDAADDAPVVLSASFRHDTRVGLVLTLGFAGRSTWLGPPDEVLAVAPRSVTEARVLLEGLSASAVFAGVRGDAAVDVDAGAAALVALAALAEARGGLSDVRLELHVGGCGVGADASAPTPQPDRQRANR